MRAFRKSRTHKVAVILSKHHRLPKKLGGTDTFPANNVIMVDPHRHEKFHAFAMNQDGLVMTVEQLVDELNAYWIDIRKKLVIEER